MVGALAVVALQVGALSTPPSGDTVGYWQQRVRYEIVARLDERLGGVHARATLTYVNNSPDTLREMFLHQYLNAFRPASKWSAVDEREGRVRFQNLRDPDYGYERFTAPPEISASEPAAPRSAVSLDYPGSPDSTVAHFSLPGPLLPGDSLRVFFAWDARPSTVLRRQGRRGRVFDFAQWYPKVAVYDRGGWEPNALVPAGEFYGEFGTYDVTLVVPEDQVLGATGVPVGGDPGWSRVSRWGEPYPAVTAYGPAGRSRSADSIPPGFKAVRFVARDVHHFAWSANPDFRYEGGVYVRRAPSTRPHFPLWDTVAVHVLYRPGDEREWGNGVAVRRTQTALAWLESVYGPYAYPQVTNLHRLEGGGTEFPMMMENGSASQGLILHEGGHLFTYGALANNEWRSGWMDEGLTSYQTSWAEGATPHDRAKAAGVGSGSALVSPAAPLRPSTGYVRHRIAPTGIDAEQIAQYGLDLARRAQPVGTRADLFREFGIYNAMVYTRAEHMYGQLRDILGDSAFSRFMHGYYDRWTLRHVDERAMRAEAERASGKELGWFFDEWVHRTGLIDYALRSVDVRRDGDAWVTRARVVKYGEYDHPMPVGARTRGGWTVVRGDAHAVDQAVVIRTAEPPLEVRLDPLRTTEDWDRRGSVATWGVPGIRFDRRVTRTSLDWPFLEMIDRDRTVVRLAPLVWWGDSTGAVFAIRGRASYLGDYDRWEYGLAVAARVPPAVAGAGRVQGWLAFDNPRLPGASRPAMGVRGGAYLLDGIALADVETGWDTSPFVFARGVRSGLSFGVLAARMVIPSLTEIGRTALPSAWDPSPFVEGRLTGRLEMINGAALSVAAGGGMRGGRPPNASMLATPGRSGFYWARAELKRRALGWAGRAEVSARAYATVATDATPRERLEGLSSADALTAFTNHWYRSPGAVLKQPGVNYQPLGGGGLRGYDPQALVRRFSSANVEAGFRAATFGPGERSLGLWLTAFADGGAYLWSPIPREGDAGVGVAVRGRLIDRPVRLRFDVPVWVQSPGKAVGERNAAAPADQRVKVRYAFSFNELW